MRCDENIDESLPKGYWDKAIEAEDEGEVNESFETLVNKLNIFTPQHSEAEYNILETLNRIQDRNFS